jgi:glycosyltransferase involved in cell wall biosynthesis
MPIDVSVIIPTYNRADFLELCLESLRGSCVDGLEVVVVDDGSTDGTAERFQADPRCIYLRQANQGPAAARNFGIDHSSGRYVAFLDSDDQWLPAVAPTLVGILDRHPEIDAVFTEARMGNPEEGYRSWIEIAGQDAFFALPHAEPEPGLRILDRVPFFRRMAERNPVFLGSMIMRRRAFDEAGRFDVELCGAADWELWLRMASRMTFAYWPEPLANYTRHADCMSNHHDRMKTEFCRSLEKILLKCPHLDRSERDWVRERLRLQAFGLAYDAYDRGEYDAAHQRFAAHLAAHGPSASSALYWAISGLPAGLPGLVRKLKRSVAG